MPKYRKPNDLNANTNCVLDHKYEYLADTIVSLCTARQTEAAEIALVAMRIRERIYRISNILIIIIVFVVIIIIAIVNVILANVVDVAVAVVVVDVEVDVDVDIEQITQLWTFRDNNKSAPVALNVIVVASVAVTVAVVVDVVVPLPLLLQ